MRDMSAFIRGNYGFCDACAGELNLRSDVNQVVKFGYGFAYRGRCPNCGGQTEVVIDKETHMAGVAWMKQVAANKEARDNILEPVNPAEAELLDFHDFLETASDETIWAELDASAL